MIFKEKHPNFNNLISIKSITNFDFLKVKYHFVQCSLRGYLNYILMIFLFKEDIVNVFQLSKSVKGFSIKSSVYFFGVGHGERKSVLEIQTGSVICSKNAIRGLSLQYFHQ